MSRALAVELVAEARCLDQRISAVADQIVAAVAESGTTLTELHGIGDLLAAEIIAHRCLEVPGRSWTSAQVGVTDDPGGAGRGQGSGKVA